MGVKKPVGFKLGALVQMGSKYTSVFASLVITMILARILTPSEYGMMSIVTVLLGLFTVISNAGINAAVIQYRDLTDADLGKLFTFTLILGIGMAALFCLLSLPVSTLYGSYEYIPLMCIASVSVFFRSANMVPDGIQIRDRQFMLNGARTIVSTVVAGVFSVVFALAGWGIYALVANSVLQALIILVWNLVASGLRPRSPEMSPLRRVMRFSSFQLASQVAQYVIRNLDNLLVGYFMGSSTLGIYDKAYKLSKYPVDYIPSTVSPVLKSYFSSLQDDGDKLYSGFLRVQRILAIAGVAAAVLFVFSGKELVLLLYGDQWTESVLPFIILSFSLPFQLVNFTIFSALEGLKRTDLLLRAVLINSFVSVVLLVAGLTVGNLIAVAVGVAAAFILATPTFLWFVIHKGFRRPVLGYLRVFLPTFAAGAVSSLVLAIVLPWIPDNLLISLVLKLLIGGGCYLVTLFLFGGLKGLAK